MLLFVASDFLAAFFAGDFLRGVFLARLGLPDVSSLFSAAAVDWVTLPPTPPARSLGLRSC
jgi:hypothetical protein